MILSTFAFTAASILINGGHGLLNPLPSSFFEASMPSFVPIAISLASWSSTSAGPLVKTLSRCGRQAWFGLASHLGTSHVPARRSCKLRLGCITVEIVAASTRPVKPKTSVHASELANATMSPISPAGIMSTATTRAKILLALATIFWHQSGRRCWMMTTVSQLNRIRAGMVLRGVLFCGLAAFCGGCTSVKISEPKRTITEQLLLSSAADRAVAGLGVSSLRGRKVYVEERYFKSYDERYALGAIRQHLSESGARLTTDEDKADIIVEVRSGGLGLDSRQSLLGIPSMGLPIPLAGPIQTPELALYKSQKTDSMAKFALFAYERSFGEHVHSTGARLGKAHFYHYKILGFFKWRNTDIPELKRRTKSRQNGAK